MKRKREKSGGASPKAVGKARSAAAGLCLGVMAAFFVARPLFPSESAAVHGDGLPMVMLWLALAAFWWLGSLGQRRFSIRFAATDAALLALLVCYALATVAAVCHGIPRSALNVFWEWIGMATSFFLARQLIETPREARAVAAVMIAAAVGIAGYGLYQSAYEMPQTRAAYHANPDAELQKAGQWYPPGSPARKLFEDRLANAEPIATFALANSLAAFLAPWTIVLAGILGLAWKRGDRRRLLAALGCLAIMAVCLALTRSRSGCAAACAGFAAIVFFIWGKKIRVGWKISTAVVVLLAAIATTAVVTGRWNAMLAPAKKSFGYRLEYWQSSLLLIADHPWLGCGPGNFQDCYTQYKLPVASEEVADPHNFLFEIWTTAGTPAALAFLMVLGCFAWTLLRGKRETGGKAVDANRNAQSADRGQGRGGQPTTSTSSVTFMPIASNKTGTNLIGSRADDFEQRRQKPCDRGTGRQTSTVDDPRACDPCPAFPYPILIGGLLGFLLSVPIGSLGAAPPSIAAVFVGLPLAAGTIAALFGWVQDGPWPRWLPGVGVVVVLIALSSSGGIGLPSVAGTFWLLLALGLQEQPPRRWPGWAAWPAFFGFFVLAVVCYATAYRPVLSAQAELRMAEQEPEHGAEHLEAAAAADRFSAEPWRRLAMLRFAEWEQSPTPAGFDRFKRADDNALRLAPRSAAMWRESGDRYAWAAAMKDSHAATEAARLAMTAYRTVVLLYPNNALDRAKLAEAYRSIGDEPAFRKEAKTALRLDKITPHNDKKLPQTWRDRLHCGLGDEDRP